MRIFLLAIFFLSSTLVHAQTAVARANVRAKPVVEPKVEETWRPTLPNGRISYAQPYQKRSGDLIMSYDENGRRTFQDLKIVGNEIRPTQPNGRVDHTRPYQKRSGDTITGYDANGRRTFQV
jgi:hypothetical protein